MVHHFNYYVSLAHFSSSPIIYDDDLNINFTWSAMVVSLFLHLVIYPDNTSRNGFKYTYDLIKK